MPAPTLLLHGSNPALEAQVRAAAAEVCEDAEVRTAEDPDALAHDALCVLLGEADAPTRPAASLGLREMVRLPVGAEDAVVRALLETAWRGLLLRRENERLRGNLRTVGRRLAHDLRTPLGSVLTLSQLLQEVVPQSNADAQGFLGSVLRSAEKLRDLIDKMSFFTKSAVDPLELAPLPLAEIVQTAQGRVAFLSMGRKGRISAPTAWPHVLGNVTGLETIWRNLLTNALLYSGEEPRIEIGWREEEGGLVRCFVRDRGPGLPAQAFAPFERLHEITNARGLGLAAVERLVTQHGGTCASAVLPEGGAEVSFTLRRA